MSFRCSHWINCESTSLFLYVLPNDVLPNVQSYTTPYVSLLGIFLNLSFSVLYFLPISILILSFILRSVYWLLLSRDQNTGLIHSVRIDNSTFERVEEFVCLGTTLTNQNSIEEEIKSRLRSGNACYHSVQNLLSSRLLSKNLKIKDI